jgi:hypothetical protein
MESEQYYQLLSFVLWLCLLQVATINVSILNGQHSAAHTESALNLPANAPTTGSVHLDVSSTDIVF